MVQIRGASSLPLAPLMVVGFGKNKQTLLSLLWQAGFSCTERRSKSLQRNAALIAPLSLADELLAQYRREGIPVIAALFPDELEFLKALWYARYDGFFYTDSPATVVKAAILAGIRHRESEEALVSSERRFRLLAESLGDVIWTLDARTWKLSYVSPSVTRLRGVSVEEALSGSIGSALSPASFEKVKQDAERRIRLREANDPAAYEPSTGELEQVSPDGTIKTIEVTVTPRFDETGSLVEYTGVARDVSERVATAKALEADLAKKNLFFAELQHRVKNNLALIASLLSLEAALLPEGHERTIFEEAQSRIRALALLYERLYRSGRSEAVALGPYLEDIVRTVISAEGRGEIRFESELAAINLDLSRAVPLGLIVDELAMNAVKHAFPEGRSGSLSLALRSEEDELVLDFRDDGVGLPPDFSLESQEGLGSRLLLLLSEQIGATIRVGSPGKKGAAFILELPLS